MSRSHFTGRRRRNRVVAAASALLLLGLGACAGGGSNKASDRPPRTIKIEMRDISFSPSAVTVKKGQEIRFVFTNNGAVQHDAFIGSPTEQAAHETEMRGGKKGTSMGGMNHGDSSESAITVQPGKTDELVTTFAESQKSIIGCHEPGHYAGGMKIAVTVE